MELTTGTRWARIEDVCEHLNVSRQTLWRFTKAGLPHSRVGGVVRFNMDQVDAWLGEQQQ